MASLFTIQYVVFYLCLILCFSGCFAHGESVVVTEDNIDILFQGQWMVKFYAPWCPACRNLRPIWDKFATEAETLNINIAEVDVTKSAGLSGRFGVTSLPTIYHVMNGEFRLYKERRKVGNMVDFVEKRKWENIESLPWWKSPNSFLMKGLGVVYTASVLLKDAHLFFTETHGLPDWASYVIFGVATISIGLIIGMVLVFITDHCIGILWPPPPIDDGQHVVDEQDVDDGDEPKESGETETPVDNSNVRKRGKVCFNNTCVDINVAYEQPNCPSNCSGNGICNNLGHCHCNNGFRCPDCKETCVGIGGSLDSGIGCDCFDPNSTIPPTTFTTIPTTIPLITNATKNITTPPRTNTTIVPVTAVPTTNVLTTNVPSTTVEETTKKSGDIDTANEDPGRKSSASASLIAVAVVVPLLIILIIAVLIFYFREQIRTKIRNIREPQQKPFTTVSYVDDCRRASSSSQANLTEVSPSRPTKLDIGGPIKNDITITPDRSSNILVTTPPRGQTNTKASGPSTPTLKPARPVLPQRPLGSRNRSLPDLLETQPSFKRSAAPSKAQSFNVADKPTRPRPPPMRTNTEKANRADVKVPKRPPSFKTGAKPTTTSDPFNRSALRNTAASSNTSQLPPTNNQTANAPAFKPSDIKAGKLPFGSPRV